MRALSVLTLLLPTLLVAQQPADIAQEKALSAQIDKLRSLPDDQRAVVTKQLALDIRKLPKSLGLASALASFATEGDFGRDTLQEVTTTLEQKMKETPPSVEDSAYVELAQLARYEHMRVTLDSPLYSVALTKLEADDKLRDQADFTLADLDGVKWSLKSLRGKVVLVNFWATWCPPCRKEMPDLEALYRRFKDQGLVILGISDEESATLKSFLAEKQKVSYPILLDRDRKINELFRVGGIPKTFLYNREGRLAAQSIDMRTEKQFLEMLAQAGIR